MKKYVPALALTGAILSVIIAAAMVIGSRAGADHPSVPSAQQSDAAAPSGTAPEETPHALTLEDIRTVSFEDVSAEDDQADCVLYVVHEGMLEGVDSRQFDPKGQVTRGDLTTVLYRMSGHEPVAYNSYFADVSADSEYAEAVTWAVDEGMIAVERAGNAFAPEERVDRAELAVALYQYAAHEDGNTYTGELSEYQDGAAVPDSARTAVDWALQNRIFAGMVSDTIHPDLPVSRDQLAQSLVALTAYNGGEPLAETLTSQLRVRGAQSVSRANHDSIQAKVDEIAAKYGASGLQVAVIEDGTVTDTYNYGWARDGVPMSSQHKIRIASISKVAVGMAAMILREEGVIDLDESIGTYWGFPIGNTMYPDDPVNIRSLLSHTSSIICYGDNTSRTFGAIQGNLRAGCFTSAQPGNILSWTYNNYAFGVLGVTLEIASDKYLDDILEERLWSVMDIDAAFEAGELDNTDLIANIYEYGGYVGLAASTQTGFHKPDFPGGTGTAFAGGLTASAEDVAKMFGLLASDGCYEGIQLMDPESIEIMETRYDYRLSDNTYQALPLRSQDNIYGRDKLYYHTGSAYGVYNIASYDPATGDGVVVLTTGASAVRDNWGLYAVCGNIHEYIYGILGGSSILVESASAQ